jgi:D-alanyl-D-alanine-carboxypeptidase/D-alanyl-D-alanine-endopeptidase
MRRSLGFVVSAASRVLVFLAIAVPRVEATAQAAFPPDSTIRALLANRVLSGQSVGIVVGLLDETGQHKVFAAGSAGSDRLPLDEHSIFEIGSITKTFTATLLAEMVLRGEARLSDPISKYLPPGSKIPSRNGRFITLADLATHYSGLPRDPTNLRPAEPNNPYADYSVEQLYNFLASYELPRTPGAEYEYSNVAMGLLGHALSWRAGESYEALVADRVLRPLGMHETAVSLTPSTRAHLAQGHDRLSGDLRPNWDHPTLAGAGGLRSSAHDMLLFAAANLATGGDILHRAMHNAQAPRRAAGEGDSIGLNWMVTRPGNRLITCHDGRTGGYASFIGLDLPARRAVVVLTNDNGDADDLGFHLLDTGVPLRVAPTIARMLVRSYRNGGLQGALETYLELASPAPSHDNIDESQLNRVGYWLLRQGKVADAIVVFKLNVERFPASFNPYDSLGEAYLANGDTAQAITSYQRSIELNPKNTNAIAVLQRLSVRR